MNYTILNTIGPAFAKEGKKILEGLGKVEYPKKLTQEQFDAKLKKADIVVVGLGLTLYEATLATAENLKVIATATTGLDHIDVDFANKRGIEVLSLRGETEFLNTITGVGELAIGMMIDLARYMSLSFEAVKRYEWERDQYAGINLRGRTLGVIGMGRLGSMTARFARGLDMRTQFYDPNVAQDSYPEDTKVSFKKLLGSSDIVSIHVHLNDKTDGLISAPELDRMKPTCLLVNTARGKIVDESALLAALKKRTIAGYATDVLAGEIDFPTKGFSKHPLVEYAKKNRNCLVLPHTGGMTIDSRIATDVFIANKIKVYFKKKSTPR